ncbi:MAG: tetratricopeptide repeat protein [Chthoniobacter sp.]
MAATLLVYWPALRNGFVWDDTALVLRDPLIRSWRLIPEGFRHFLFLDATASNFYRPIQRLSFVFDYQVYGFDRPWGWHLTSILIHAGAAVALFFAAERLLAEMAGRLESRNRLSIAFGVAVIWAIHPLQTSAVTYVAGRADPLAALFGFTGLALGLSSRAWPWKLGAAVCFFLAMLSKESGILFLPLWLLILAWRPETRRALVSWGLIVIVLVAAYSGLRFTSEKVAPPAAPPTPAAIRPILTARAFAGYAGLLVAPVTLRMERDVTTRPLDTPEATFRQARALEFQTLAGVLLLIGFIFWMRYCLRREPAAALCLAAFVIAYLPISNLLPLNATIAEHWLYVPGAFLFLAVALTLQRVLQRPAVLLIAGCWVLFLGVRTFVRQADWHDQRTFIERTIAAGGNSARMLMNLGNVEFTAGHQDAALALYREALRHTPDQPIIWLGYASILLRAHDLPHAKEALEHAETSPLLAADCLSLRASMEAAESNHDPGELLRQAVAAAPDNWGIRQRYIEYLRERSGSPEALRELRGFLQQHDFRADSWRLLSALLDEQQQPDLAAAARREAARRDVREAEHWHLVSAPSHGNVR